MTSKARLQKCVWLKTSIIHLSLGYVSPFRAVRSCFSVWITMVEVICSIIWATRKTAGCRRNEHIFIPPNLCLVSIICINTVSSIGLSVCWKEERVWCFDIVLAISNRRMWWLTAMDTLRWWILDLLNCMFPSIKELIRWQDHHNTPLQSCFCQKRRDHMALQPTGGVWVSSYSRWASVSRHFTTAMWKKCMIAFSTRNLHSRDIRFSLMIFATFSRKYASRLRCWREFILFLRSFCRKIRSNASEVA